MVDRGLGVSLVPDWARPWPEGLQLARLPLPESVYRRIGVIWSRASVRLRLVTVLLQDARSTIARWCARITQQKLESEHTGAGSISVGRVHRMDVQRCAWCIKGRQHGPITVRSHHRRAASVVAGASAYAQQTNQSAQDRRTTCRLEEVIVTGTRRAKAVDKIPVRSPSSSEEEIAHSLALTEDATAVLARSVPGYSESSQAMSNPRGDAAGSRPAASVRRRSAEFAAARRESQRHVHGHGPSRASK